MYALADCNNFFVSCERAFQPELEGLPVVVLSNNDGCVVARSNESKAMGIKMGTPFFKIKSLVDSGRLFVRSSNYTLYGDLSARVMSILSGAFPEIEIYSIDEAFLIPDGIDQNVLPEYCRDLVRHVRHCTGIPISIGIAETRTLAKVANHFAKRYKGYKGVCVIDSEDKRRKALSLTPIDDVWGIGRRLSPRLVKAGVNTALDFATRPEEWAKTMIGLSGVRTYRELNGKDSVTAEEKSRRQSICTSRSFADMISDEKELILRVSDFAAMCARKLRKEHSAASTVVVFLYTNRFREDLDQYYPSAVVPLPVAANNTQEIVTAAINGLHTIYRPDFLYKKAGVIVTDIVPDDEIQATIFDFDDSQREKDDKISAVMDSVNKDGKNLLRLASQRPGHYADGIRSDFCSKPFTTSWNDLLEIK